MQAPCQRGLVCLQVPAQQRLLQLLLVVHATAAGVAKEQITADLLVHGGNKASSLHWLDVSFAAA
jgi:hypothetical protein